MTSDGSRGRSVLNLLAVGTTLVTCIVLGSLGGAWLDRRFDTAPWFLIGGLTLGTAAGFLELFRTVARNLK